MSVKSVRACKRVEEWGFFFKLFSAEYRDFFEKL